MKQCIIVAGSCTKMLHHQLTLMSKLHLDEVNSQRELLLDFAEYSENDKKSEHLDELVDNYLDSIKQ